jgi:4-hydroxy-tetrahydrodipicolinate synthase
MSIETMQELSKLDNIVGVKDATQDLFRPLLTQKYIKKPFCYLSGEDGTMVPFLAQGGHGCISVTANIAPKLCAELHNNWMKKNYDEVFNINLKLAKIHHAIFIESSPGPVKYAAELLGLCSSETRLPLTSIKNSTKEIVEESMREVGLL